MQTYLVEGHTLASQKTLLQLSLAAQMCSRPLEEGHKYPQ